MDQIPSLKLVTREDYLRGLELIIKDQKCSRWYVQKYACVGYPKACEIVAAFETNDFISKKPSGRYVVNATWKDLDDLTASFKEADETEAAEQAAKEALWKSQDDPTALVEAQRKPPQFRSQMLFNENAFSEILDGVSRGGALSSILQDRPHLPSFSRWTQWLEEDNPDADLRRRRYQYARLARADGLAEHILSASDDDSQDMKIIQLPGGVESVVADGQNVQRAKLRVETRKWILSKMFPEYWGDTVDPERDRSLLLRGQAAPAIDIASLSPDARTKLTHFLEQVEADKAAKTSVA